MTKHSWWMPLPDHLQYQLPDQIRRQDRLAGRDCGWITQMQPFVSEFSQPGDCVLDPFCGFGSTLIAAALEQRYGVGYEIDPQRVLFARQRLIQHRFDGEIIEGTITDKTPKTQAQLLLTSVPYFGCAWSHDRTDSAQLYDQSTLASYLTGLREVFYSARKYLSDNGYCIVMVQNITLGNRVIPIAWELAKILDSLFITCEEQILCYPERAGDSEHHFNSPARTDRSHEYALVYRKGSYPIDIEGSRKLIYQLRQDGFRFVVKGSFSAWENVEHIPTNDIKTPYDVDICINANQIELTRLLRWLIHQGFRLSIWGEPVNADVQIATIEDKYYLFAERLDSDGSCIRLDLMIDRSQYAS